jgi:endonuclease YncB( thermonuclease family)
MPLAASPSTRSCLFHIVLVVTAVASVWVSPLSAGETFRGPVEARVVRVIDGDTFVAEALLWPGHRLAVTVRLRGIDAPELRSRCWRERRAAKVARAALEGMVGHGPVAISNVAGGKYYGRVLADVITPDGTALAPALLALAVVRPYRGGRRDTWC